MHDVLLQIKPSTPPRKVKIPDSRPTAFLWSSRSSSDETGGNHDHRGAIKVIEALPDDAFFGDIVEELRHLEPDAVGEPSE